MKHLFKTALFFVFSFVLVSLLSCGKHENVTTLKIAHSLDTSHPVHKAMEFMGERLKVLSEGRMRIDIYPSGQLGSERELIELLQIGGLAMTKVSASPLEAFIPEMKVFSLPYIFRDSEHYWQVLNGPIGQRLLHSGEKFRIRGLAYYDAGSRSFYSTKKAIHSPADLSGMKIRVQNSQTAVSMVKAMGGSATPVSWGELYTSLQQGVVDGAENNPPSFYLSKHYEVSKYYTIDEHTSIPDIILISTHVWNKLSENQKKLLQQAADESVEFQRKLWSTASEEALKSVVDAGVQIIRPDKSLFKNKVTSIYQDPALQALSRVLEQIQQQGQ